MMENSQALFYIALVCDAKEHNTEEENAGFVKANQNRLNQNFTSIAGRLEDLQARIDALESSLS